MLRGCCSIGVGCRSIVVLRVFVSIWDPIFLILSSNFARMLFHRGWMSFHRG
jgi:hypothetical protein